MAELNVGVLSCSLEHIGLMAEGVSEDHGAAAVNQVERSLVALVGLGNVGLENNLIVTKSESSLCLSCGINEVQVIGGVFVMQENEADLETVIGYRGSVGRCIGAYRRIVGRDRVTGVCRGLLASAGDKRQHHNGNQSKSKKLSHFSSVFIPRIFGATLRGMNHVFIVTGSGAPAQVIFSTNFATARRIFYTDFTRFIFRRHIFPFSSCQADFDML